MVCLGSIGGRPPSYVERNFVGASGPEFALTLAQRFLLASRAICFYFEKLIWPANLTFFYPAVDPRSSRLVAVSLSVRSVGDSCGWGMACGAAAGLFLAASLFFVVHCFQRK